MNKELQAQDDAYADYMFNPTPENKAACEAADYNLRVAIDRWVNAECDKQLIRTKFKNFVSRIFK